MTHPTQHNQIAASGPEADPEMSALLEEIDALLMARKKIEAVKVVRERVGIGLKESLEVVNDRERQLNIPRSKGLLARLFGR